MTSIHVIHLLPDKGPHIFPPLTLWYSVYSKSARVGHVAIIIDYVLMSYRDWKARSFSIGCLSCVPPFQERCEHRPARRVLEHAQVEHGLVGYFGRQPHLHSVRGKFNVLLS